MVKDGRNWDGFTFLRMHNDTPKRHEEITGAGTEEKYWST